MSASTRSRRVSWRSLGFALLGLCAMGSLAWVPMDQAYLREQEQLLALEKLKKKWPKQPIAKVHCQPKACSKRMRWELKRKGLLQGKGSHRLHLRSLQASSHSRETVLEVKIASSTTGALLLHSTTRQRRFHWMGLLPPLAAIFFALLTRKILTSLLLSLLLGAMLLTQSVWLGVQQTFAVYIWEKAIFKEFSFNIILFTLALIGMINVCTRNGGVRGMIQRLVQYATTARSSRIMTAFLGLLIFFDDYANTIVVGNTMRPLTDRFRVSREKLAYLIDSTAAPMAGLALLSTWIGYEVGLLGEISTGLQLSMGGYQLFLASLPYRFYCWMTLIFVFVAVFSDRDYGPMLKAERRAFEEGKLLRDGAQPMIKLDLTRLEPPEDIPARAFNVIVPVMVVLCSVVGGLMWAGGFFSGKSAYEALKAASFNSSRVFLVAALLGSVVAIGLSIVQQLLPPKEALKAWLAGASAMGFAVGILIFAWAMSALARDLGTAYTLIAILQGHLAPELLPLLVFFMSAAVSFATGTSWGTMGILLPTVGPLAYALGGIGVLVLSVGAVLDGSIFGDHCSPLSDTTLFSSAAAACDHIDHVQTQAPYALTVMSVASIGGYLAVAYRFPVWASALLAIALFIAIFRFFGRPIEQPSGAHP